MSTDMMEFQSVIEHHQEAIAKIKDTGYYIEIFESVLQDWLHDWDSVEKMTILEDICYFWNDFWNALPDSPAIHENKVFYQICDLAEGGYLEE